MNTYPVQLTCHQESTIYYNAMHSRVTMARKAWGQRKNKDIYAMFRETWHKWRGIEITMRKQSGRKIWKYRPQD
jgi:hypothetical protein